MNKLHLEHEFLRNLISSLILVVTVIFIRIVALRTVERWRVPSNETRRRWIVQIRNTAILMGLLGLFFIWGSELKAFAVSLVAIAAAFVIATKELILCLLGGMMKYTSHLFSIGDRIEVLHLRGDVISHNMLTTTVNEIGPGKDMHQFTGRVIQIPNSMFLTNPMINETETGDYVLHVFRVPFRRNDNWHEEKRRLLKAAQRECGPYVALAKAQFERLAKKEGLETPTIEPRISIAFPEPDRVDLVVRIPAPSRRKGKIEQEILLRYSEIDSEGADLGLGLASETAVRSNLPVLPATTSPI